MKNLIPKTALKTILAVLIALVLAFGILSLGFPAQMASICENMGNYTFATGYASLNYTYTGKISDLARCVDDSILSENEADIVSFGDKFIADKQAFRAYCAEREANDSRFSYTQYVLGSLTAAKYARGDRDGAVEVALFAMEGIENFPAPNALGILASRAIEKGDSQTMDELYSEAQKHTPAVGEEEYYNTVLKSLSGYIN